MSEDKTIPRRLAFLLEHVMHELPFRARYLGMPHLFCNLVSARLMRLYHRLRHLLATGPLPARPPRTTKRATPANPANPAKPINPDDYVLPTGFAWLRRVFPGTQVVLAHHQLRTLLDEPETQTLIASHPALARSIRPLCHMLGLKPPSYLKLPRRPRTHRTPSPTPAPEKPPKLPRKTWAPAPPPRPMTPAEAQLAARQFFNPRDFYL